MGRYDGPWSLGLLGFGRVSITSLFQMAGGEAGVGIREVEKLAQVA